MLETLLVWQTALVVVAVYSLVTLTKNAVGVYLPDLRNRPLFKRVALPMLATVLGVAIGWFVHPSEVSTTSEIILYGSVVGYLSTALWRHLLGLIPALKAVDERLSLRPTIPAPPNVVSDSVSQAEQRLP